MSRLTVVFGIALMALAGCMADARAGQIRGFITRMDGGERLAGVHVAVHAAWGKRDTETNANGFYSFVELDSGQYWIEAKEGDLSEVVWGIFVCPSGANEIDLELHGKGIYDQFQPAWSIWALRGRSTSDSYSLSGNDNGSFGGLDPCL